MKPPKGPATIKKDLEKRGQWTEDKEERLLDMVDPVWLGSLDGQKYLDLWKDQVSRDPSRSPLNAGSKVILPGKVADLDVLQQVGSTARVNAKS
jgi:hypothetical protein